MKTILCYGDSNTYGYDTHTGKRFDKAIRWPGRLQLILGDEYAVIEEGCNGRTACYTDEEEPWKMGFSSFTAILNSHKPVDLVILMLGTNDLKKKFDPDPAEITAAMGTYIAETRRFSKVKNLPEPQILLIAPPQLGHGIFTTSSFSDSFNDRSRELSRILDENYKKLAEETGILFLDASDYTDVSSEDSLHLDIEGHRLLSDAVYEFLCEAGVIPKKEKETMEERQLAYKMREHLFAGPDGRDRLGLRFVFSAAGSRTVPAGTSVGTFLKDYQHFSKRQISSLKFREDGIRVNGIMRRVTWSLHPGDVLEIVLKSAGSLYLDHGTFTKPPEILYEDSELLIVNKPSGMVCHPSPGHYADTLANQAAAYAARSNENWTIRLVGRLDKDTSGIVFFAKNSETAARLSSGRSVEKEYRAIACGTLPPAGSICASIAPDDSILGKMKIDPAGKQAETVYETIAVIKGESLVDEYSFLKIRLIHGRTHQIRLHFASIGHPLLGDTMYGNGSKGETHAFLHCRSAKFLHPFTGEEIYVEAPFPADWPFPDSLPV